MLESLKKELAAALKSCSSFDDREDIIIFLEKVSQEFLEEYYNDTNILEYIDDDIISEIYKIIKERADEYWSSEQV